MEHPGGVTLWAKKTKDWALITESGPDMFEGPVVEAMDNEITHKKSLSERSEVLKDEIPVKHIALRTAGRGKDMKPHQRRRTGGGWYLLSKGAESFYKGRTVTNAPRRSRQRVDPLDLTTGRPLFT